VYREFVEQRYPLQRTLRLIDELIASFEQAEIGPSANHLAPEAVGAE